MNMSPLIAISAGKESENLLTVTASHLLLGQQLFAFPSSLDSLNLDKLAKIIVQSRWEQRKRIQRQFFLRFQEEYLDALKQRASHHDPQQYIKENDVVFRLGERNSRLHWPISRVEKCYY